MFADISGFTALTERLALRGPAGIEELTDHLSAYFSPIVDLIDDYGGDVIKFAGDALLVAWPATNEPLATVTQAAAQCSLKILADLHNYVVDDIRFNLHIGIAAGEVVGLHVGGVMARWEFLIAGDPLRQIASATANAKSGEVYISSTTWPLIQASCRGTALPSGDVRLEAVLKPQPVSPSSIPAFRPEIADVVRSYIPAGIVARLDSGQTQWLAELRHVTVMFVELVGLDYPPAVPLELIQQTVRTMQTAIYQYEGVIRQFMRDDKGSVLIAVFGLPPYAHENDAERALLAATTLQDRLSHLGLRSAIGITTGSVYCGLIGNSTRCEYTVIGDVVNLAARLMKAAQGGILCDEASYYAARDRLILEPLSPIKVKGKLHPIPVYFPSGQVRKYVRQKTAIVGRTTEQQLLRSKVEALLQGQSGIVAIEGEAGIGKSCLLDHLIDWSQNLRLTVSMGRGDAIENSKPYHAWQPVFEQLLGLETIADPETRRNHVLAQLSLDGQPSLFAPLLNSIVLLDLPENEITGEMTGQVRSENTRDLLIELLQQAADRSPLLLILEDAHWFDSASWALTLAVSQRVRPLLLVLAIRPFADVPPNEYQQLLKSAHHLQLQGLPPQEAIALVCQRLAVESLPEQVVQLLQEKAEGNPFFSEELARALCESGLIIVEENQCHLCPEVKKLGSQGLTSLPIPNTVQGLITSRIDRLTPSQQLTLKVASVVGRIFRSCILKSIHPIQADRDSLTPCLNALESLGLTQIQTPQPDISYLFNHIITQEVAYNLMLYAQRRSLHKSVAEWYEANYAEDLSPFYPLLAYHWQKAEVIDKTIEYLELAGEQAFHSYSLREAIRFLTEAIDLSGNSKHSAKVQDAAFNPDKLRLARWERQLGEAYLGLGQLPESRAHLAQSLILLGRPMPTNYLWLTSRLLWQIGKQILHRLGYIRVQKNVTTNLRLLETARVYDLLAEIYYHANEILASIYASIRTLNLAERVGSSPELARAYANSCFAAAMIPFHWLAALYSHRAEATARIVNQPLQADARVLIVTNLYNIGTGHWQKIEDGLRQSVEICNRFGDWHQLGNSLAILAKAAYHQGHFERGIERWQEVYRIAKRNEDILHQAWGLNGQAEGILRLGEVDTAVNLLESAITLFSQNQDRVSETATYGVLAQARWCQGEVHLARQAADITAHKLAQFSSPSSHYLIEGYAGAAQVYLALWEAASNSGENSDTTELRALVQSSHQAVKAFQQFARIFPVGTPRYLLVQGLFHWLSGRRNRAHKAWEKSLTAAKKLGMPYEQGLANYEIGRHSNG